VGWTHLVIEDEGKVSCGKVSILKNDRSVNANTSRPSNKSATSKSFLKIIP
jgi:hypothetical protein